MILIQSQKDDPSADDVMAWLYYLHPHEKLQRINNETEIQKVSYTITNEEASLAIEANGMRFHNKEIVDRWYRQGELMIDKLHYTADTLNEFLLSMGSKGHLEREFRSLHDEVDLMLSRSGKSIGKFRDNEKGKLENMLIARQAGLSIPPTLFTNDADDLLQFVEKHQKIITKANHNNRYTVSLTDVDVTFGSDTYLLDKAGVEELGSMFEGDQRPVPSFFQAYIEKAYELRIFFLNGKLFPMAIFSQENEQTKIDFRKYDLKRPNRCVPYILPDALSGKIKQFMKLMDMNCGSLDMIYTPAGEFYFLEVNPIGQYQWLDKNCNYFLDREIARFLYHG